MVFAKSSKQIFILLWLVLELTAETEFDWNFFQDDYHFKIERADVSSYNKNYMKTASLVSFKYNRTTVALNLTLNFNMDVRSELVTVIQVYKFASNEYRIFPLRIGTKFCKLFEANVAGLKEAAKCGNFSHCLYLKNKTYRICNFVVDESKLPPHFPTGRYKVEMQMSYESVDIFLINGYFEVTRSEVKQYT